MLNLSLEELLYFVPLGLCWIITLVLPFLKYKKIIYIDGYGVVFVVSFFVFIFGMIPLLNIPLAFVFVLFILESVGEHLDRKNKK